MRILLASFSLLALLGLAACNDSATQSDAGQPLDQETTTGSTTPPVTEDETTAPTTTE